MKKKLAYYDAVLFDMDGVITDTAGGHAAAWKQVFDDCLQKHATATGEAFMPFDPEHDYRRYVDGKPRYDGVTSFLQARGIELPFGEPGDEPGQPTVCGLGNRKNGYFNRWLKQHKVRTYDDALIFIETLRRKNIKTAVFSASRNCRAVLTSAGVTDLFDVKFDGTDLAELNLPGKPDPAMLLLCAERLGVRPRCAMIIEDSIAGVRAGRRGGFGRVIGVDRESPGGGHHATALAAAGADRVVSDLRDEVVLECLVWPDKTKL